MAKAALCIAILLGGSVSPRAQPQTSWLVGGWSYETVTINQRNEVVARFNGNFSSTRTGRVIRFGPINAGTGLEGTLSGYVRDSGEITWNYTYGLGNACSPGRQLVAWVTLVPAQRKLQIRVPHYSGRLCDFIGHGIRL
jgi:hypothetical protein